MPAVLKIGNGCEYQDVYLKIEKVFNYSPVDPDPNHTYNYKKDCFRRKGHEDGTIDIDEVNSRKLTALVYRKYTDNTYNTISPDPLIASDLSEPPTNSLVPGVVIYTKPGKRLRIHVYNVDDNPHSLHMHGIKYGIESDGAYPLGIKNNDGVRSDQICPGEKYTYHYKVTEDMTGAWVFHDHHKNLGDNVRLGLFGGLVVLDPCWPKVNYEIPFFLHKMAGIKSAPLFDSDDILSNGTFNRTFNTMGEFNYECFYHPMFGSVKVKSGALQNVNVSILDNQFDPASISVAPGGTVTWTNNGLSVHTILENGSSKSNTSMCINGRAFAGNTPVIEMESGKKVRWYVFNLDLQTEWHNFHPHASHWEFGGQNLDNRSIGPAEAFVVHTKVPQVIVPPCEEFDGPSKTVDLAANFPIHCHVEPHVMGGMVALMRIKQEVTLHESFINSLNFPLPLDNGTFDCPTPDANLCFAGIDNGAWEILPVAPEFAVHGALLNTGKVIIWSGHAERGPTFGLTTAIYNPATNSYTTIPFSDNDDLFCAGHCFLSDGRLIAGGGANQGQVRSTHIFDPTNESWSRLYGGDLANPRWYPTMVTLNDGRICIVSGTAGGTVGTVEEIEVLDLTKTPPPPNTGVYYWEVMLGSQKPFSGLYPGLHWLPSGDLYFTRTGWNSHNLGTNDSSRFRLSGPLAGNWTDLAPLISPDRKEGSSVILIDESGANTLTKVFVSGGRNNTSPAISECEIIDISDPLTTSGWQQTTNMNQARIGVSSVILPNGKVMVVGGRQTSGRFDPSPIFVMTCEIYDPQNDSWSVTPAMNYPRQYHSIALLLSDGRVFTSGGVNYTTGIGEYNRKDTEVYSPEYLNGGATSRPVIDNVANIAGYATNLTIQTSDANNLDSVCLIAPGCISHHTDSAQRYIKLKTFNVTASSIDITTPANGNIAPPGYYMLFIINSTGVPSLAKFVKIG